MDDTVVRLVVVLTGVLVVVVVAAAVKAKKGRLSRTLPATGLGPGIYLFTSEECDECATARARLDRFIGRAGYIEIKWETRSAEFDRMRITEVPSTLVVSEDDSAVWHRGVPSGIAKPGNP